METQVSCRGESWSLVNGIAQDHSVGSIPTASLFACAVCLRPFSVGSIAAVRKVEVEEGKEELPRCPLD